MNFLRKLTNSENKKLNDCIANIGQEFNSLTDAENYYYQIRDSELNEIKNIETQFPKLLLDGSGESLQRLEDFYFECYVDNKIKIEIPKSQFENLITQYTRHVFVNNNIDKWTVFENEFSPGKYELGLISENGVTSNQHYGEDLDKKEKSELRKYLKTWFDIYS